MKGESVKSFMDTWLLQINYPEVDAILFNTQTSLNSVVRFVQGRFLLNQLDEDNETPFDPPVSPFK